LAIDKCLQKRLETVQNANYTEGSFFSLNSEVQTKKGPLSIIGILDRLGIISALRKSKCG
jgi:hypothetical protein